MHYIKPHSTNPPKEFKKSNILNQFSQCIEEIREDFQNIDRDREASLFDSQNSYECLNGSCTTTVTEVDTEMEAVIEQFFKVQSSEEAAKLGKSFVSFLDSKLKIKKDFKFRDYNDNTTTISDSLTKQETSVLEKWLKLQRSQYCISGTEMKNLRKSLRDMPFDSKKLTNGFQDRMINLILDIDETVLFTERLEIDSDIGLNDVRYENRYNKEVLLYSLIKKGRVEEKEYYKSTLRNNVKEFLERVSKYAYLFINTAGVKAYAEKIKELLEKKIDGLKIEEIVYRELNSVYSDISKMFSTGKKVSQFKMIREYNAALKESTFILDDNTFVWPEDKDKLIQVKKFQTKYIPVDHKYISLLQSDLIRKIPELSANKLQPDENIDGMDIDEINSFPSEGLYPVDNQYQLG